MGPKAVLDNDLTLLSDLSKTALPLLEMKNNRGFDAIELAQYLKKQSILDIIHPKEEKEFIVRLKGENIDRTLSRKEFEESFRFSYWPSLYFANYETFIKVIKNCPYLLRNELFGEDNINLGKFYDQDIREGYVAKTSIRWIDDTIGYGLFAEENLVKGDLVGEYAGEVRRLNRLKPDYNAYCFHYPTKFWSRYYYIIDSKTIGNELRFANHSSTPNMKPNWVVKSGLLHMVFSTKSAIEKGSELTFDYGQNLRFENDLSHRR